MIDIYSKDYFNSKTSDNYFEEQDIESMYDKDWDDYYVAWEDEEMY